MQRYCLWLER